LPIYADGGLSRHRRIINTDATVVEYPLDPNADPVDLLLKVESVGADARAGISRMGSELSPSRSSNW
jgi:hypothetical protein